MKKIAIIGANEFQNPLILKAKELGYETHVFAWQSGDIGEKSADFFYPISIVEKEEIFNKCREIGVDAVCSVGSDLAVLTVNYVARKMGFPCNPDYTDTHATNKYLMRSAFEKAGVPVPHYMYSEGKVPTDIVNKMKFPLIVKPTDRSGSRGIFKIETRGELSAAIEAACEESFEKRAIIEEYIEGEEYSAEGISFDGEHHILAFTKKYTTGAPHFIETGHMEPSDLSAEVKKKAEKTIKNALDALQIKMGASHSEFRVTENGDIRIIEIGARMGGDCIGTDLVEISTGLDFVKMVIDVACGLKPSFEKVRQPRRAEIYFIFTNDDLKKYENIREKHPDKIWRASQIQKIKEGTVTDSSNRFGYYILQGEEI